MYLPCISQVPPLLDALLKNGSLTYLDLSGSGLGWRGPHASGRPLADAMALNAAALSSLQSLVISSTSGFEVPVARLRSGHTEALATLRSMTFLGQSGPWR
jgi:hypothetical protein